MTRTPLELARDIYLPGTDLAAVFADERLLDSFTRRLRERAKPDLIAGDPQNKLLGMAPGVDRFVDTWRDWISAWDMWRIERLEFHPGETSDCVLVLLDIRARSRTESVEMEQEGANVLWFEDGLVSRLELYFDRDDARRAAGIEN
jgi:hypothetical protein